MSGRHHVVASTETTARVRRPRASASATVPRWPGRRALLVALLALAWPVTPSAAQKPQPAVGAAWAQVPARRPLGRRVRVVLRLMASEAAPHLTIRLLPSAGVAVVGWATPRRVAMRKGQILELPVTFRVTADGSWTLGASVTNRQPDDEQISGAVLNIVAQNGTASFSKE